MNEQSTCWITHCSRRGEHQHGGTHPCGDNDSSEDSFLVLHTRSTLDHMDHLEQRGPQKNAGLDTICQDEVSSDTASDCSEASTAVRGCAGAVESVFDGQVSV